MILRAAVLDHAALLCKVATEESAMAHSQSSERFVRDTTWRALTKTTEAMNALIAIGAAVPFDETSDETFQFYNEEMPSSESGLGALSRLDSPDARGLIAILEIAVLLAERIEAERDSGSAATQYFLPPASTNPYIASHNVSEILCDVVERLRDEIYGPQGRD